MSKTTPRDTPQASYAIPSVSITTAHTGASSQPDELGMRAMQSRAYNKRGEQYLLIKSPPASGKSRALMFIALDKLHNQGLRQAIVAVPERSIGSSFADEPLSEFGFHWDWKVEPKWNLCNAPGVEDAAFAKSKVKAVGEFLKSTDKVLVCTHATFRFAMDELGAEAFDERLIAIDEFHHVSSSNDNKLGKHISELMARDKVHVVAMTGSFFRGDNVAVLSPADEERFDTVAFTYYEQLNGYQWLKTLDIGYYFYGNSPEGGASSTPGKRTNGYLDALHKVLDPALKTIVHIPNVNSRESMKDKLREVDSIMEHLGEWSGVDPVTGFHLVKSSTRRTLKVADLVDDSDAAKRTKVLNALKDPAHKNNRDHVDVIIALGMAKEGFDWIWCEHALTIGYRSSLTEIVQIIGRATRDAKDKARSRFSNLIGEPNDTQGIVVEGVNDMLKAIAASLLMEQVLAPTYTFTPKNAGPRKGFDYGEDGYKKDGTNVGVNPKTGEVHVEIKGLATPTSTEATRICKDDLNEVVTSFLQDKSTVEQGLLNKENTAPEELTQLRMGKIVKDRYPELSEADQEVIRQHAITVMAVNQLFKKARDFVNQGEEGDGGNEVGATGRGATRQSGTTSGDDMGKAFLKGVRKFVNIRDLDIDLIDRINPFDTAYAVMAKAMSPSLLQQVQNSIARKKGTISEDEARALAVRALAFKKDHGRLPSSTSADPWECRMAEGMQALLNYMAKAKAKAAQATNGATNG